jgi:hypothetical protein
VADLTVEKQVRKDITQEKLISPTRRGGALPFNTLGKGLSERHACRLVGQPRGPSAISLRNVTAA